MMYIHSLLSSNSQLYNAMSNCYYTYSACCELTTFSPKVHRIFSVIDMVMCLDIFPAYERLKTSIYQVAHATATAEKVHAFVDTISESVGMFSDAYWFIEEMNSFNIVQIPTMMWAKVLYERISFLQYLWVVSSTYQSAKILAFTIRLRTICKNLTSNTSDEKNQKALQKSCSYILQNYEILEKNFTIPSSLRAQLAEIMKEPSHKTALLHFKKIRAKITTQSLLDTASAVNNFVYYFLSIFRPTLPIAKAVPFLLVACCISSFALSLLSKNSSCCFIV
jgi:hypothetical protein